MKSIYLSVLCLVLMYLYVMIINVEYPGYTQKELYKNNFVIILISILNEMHCRRLLRQCTETSISRNKNKTNITAIKMSLTRKYEVLGVINVLGEHLGWTHGKNKISMDIVEGQKTKFFKIANHNKND